jgi:hypothetical protein
MNDRIQPLSMPGVLQHKKKSLPQSWIMLVDKSIRG